MSIDIVDIYEAMRRLPSGVHPDKVSSRVRFGEHKSAFVGSGHDFFQIREYDPYRDTPNDIDWYLSTEPDEVYVKDYIEPKEVVTIIALDLSSSMSFGVEEPRKQRLLLELAGTLGITAAHDKDRVGLVGFTEKPVIVQPPKVGEGHIYYFLKRVHNFINNTDVIGRETNLFNLLGFLRRRFTKPCMVFILSDFLGWEDIGDSPLLKTVSSKHELIFGIIEDPEEFDVGGSWGSMQVRDMETGNLVTIPVSKMKKVREQIRKNRRSMMRDLDRRGVDSVELTYGDHIPQLAGFLEQRRQKGGG